MPRSIRISLLLLLSAALAGLSACASSDATPPVTAPSTGATGQNTHNGSGQSYPFPFGSQCPSTATDPAIAKLKADSDEVPLPADFHAVRAVRCISSLRTVPGDGEWQFADAQSADSGLAPFLAALKLPSQSPPPGQAIACTADAILIPPFALVDVSGAIVRPKLPTTYCAKPLPEVLTALNNLPWRTETEQKLNQTQTQPEIDTGCPSKYKDLFEFPMATTAPGPEMSAPSDAGPTTACAYSVSGSGLNAAGTFSHGVKLTAAQQTVIGQALAQAKQTDAPACSTPATRFALLSGPDGGDPLIELDGCHRIDWFYGLKSPAPASLLSALAAAGIS
jgi:hypothetical protein